MRPEEFDRSVIEGVTADVVKTFWPWLRQWPRKARLAIVQRIHDIAEHEYRKLGIVQGTEDS